MRVKPNSDHSDFNVTNDFAFCFTSGFYIDEHYAHIFFYKNSYLDENTEK